MMDVGKGEGKEGMNNDILTFVSNYITIKL